MRTAEFDAFGPWIYQVTVPEDVPRLFRPYPLHLDEALVVLKVPRGISRRDADPTMDLYDLLLVAEPSGLTVLTRTEGAPGRVTPFTTRVIAWPDIYAVEESVDLVDGLLTLLTAQGPVLIPFNGSSEVEVARLVGLIRSRYAPEGRPTEDARPAAGAVGTADVNLPDVELDLQNVHRRLRRDEPGFRCVAVQHRAAVHSISPSRLVRAVWNLWPTALQTTLCYTDDRELLVIHRRDGVVRGFKPVYSIARTTFVLDRVTGVAIVDDTVVAPVRIVEVHLDDVVVSIPFLASSGALDTLVQLLSAAIPRALT